VTPRDIEILSALERTPLTVRQLLTLSRTFALPFHSERRIQERLQALADASRVQRRLYAVAGRGGAPSYYQLTLHGYRILHGEGTAGPSRRAFNEVGIAHQHHTRCLAEFLVHTFLCARESGIGVDDFYRENALRLDAGQGTLFPDSAFQLRSPGGEAFNFLVELDNGSERIRSQKDVESWEAKIRLYEALQDATPRRFRVLIVCTRSQDRLRHIFDAAAALSRNPRRSLFYGVHLDDYLAEPQALHQPCFLDHRGAAVAVIPAAASPRPRRRERLAADAWLGEGLFA
jgi:hypothetical protein